MNVILRIVGALILTYLISRITLRLPIFAKRTWGLVLAHIVALGAAAAIIAAIRAPAGAFSPLQLIVYAAAQVCWFLFDKLCRNYPRGRG